MNLLNVRKGQFVYYKNKLHKVYSVKAFFKQSIHLVRLEDYEQQLATAKEITLYKPKHMDSFIVNHKRYTLHKDVKAKVGDYILIINPQPDSLDHHHLHAMEIVSSIEPYGVISNQSNGIKHNEYWTMIPGLEEGANIIDVENQDADYIHEQKQVLHEIHTPKTYVPKIGDVYQRNNNGPILQAMVVAIQGETVYLGGNLEVQLDELTDADSWSFVHNILN
ncbi:hypothetical protein SporoP37_04905 [Sporosarcina sp. P37]|uniref:hypothetical protein n=1 Tax=unclassified Sporosarcina TaxID=2647733 RepID=UPI0009BDD982|nr:MULTISPECIES: hypothetical protein [unclassified Sporosarcina]ARD47497.1 hypothetical protein SporoP33_04100 [Sporosarcina sp. P33]ARK24086.1 hypothetical protein SporoP37_04905 [Sporosarcina sp. P37]PID18522.1 hypothetical protein CSV62_07675 [Sporosarcina sp. P35]